MTDQQGMALLTILEEMIPVGIGLYKQLQATIEDHGTKKFEDLLMEADANFSHVLKNVQAEKDALLLTPGPVPSASVPDATGTSTPVAPPPSTPKVSPGSPGSGTAVPPKTA